MSTYNIHPHNKKEHFSKILLNICFLELLEDFPRDSKTSSNQPR